MSMGKPGTDMAAMKKQTAAVSRHGWRAASPGATVTLRFAVTDRASTDVRFQIRPLRLSDLGG